MSNRKLAIGTNAENAHWSRRRKVLAAINGRLDITEGAGKVSNWFRTSGVGNTTGFDYSAFRQALLV